MSSATLHPPHVVAPLRKHWDETPQCRQQWGCHATAGTPAYEAGFSKYLSDHMRTFPTNQAAADTGGALEVDGRTIPADVVAPLRKLWDESRERRLAFNCTASAGSVDYQKGFTQYVLGHMRTNRGDFSAKSADGPINVNGPTDIDGREVPRAELLQYEQLWHTSAAIRSEAGCTAAVGTPEYAQGLLAYQYAAARRRTAELQAEIDAFNT
jgi:hypothetical protein